MLAVPKETLQTRASLDRKSGPLLTKKNCSNARITNHNEQMSPDDNMFNL